MFSLIRGLEENLSPFENTSVSLENSLLTERSVMTENRKPANPASAHSLQDIKSNSHPLQNIAKFTNKLQVYFP